ncbi:hypothetical protein XF_1180 [Xylella fastidiosa 9a5c]|uniref:Uncharacterized protein n=1 Tax=Xylella fastidiosa (strain 9a5c) TaxID=160492 RepID=Q9PE48_XYLFA|nr:hypothetical protein XF_1180 [Xylella fastidiosa 9a5c]
MRRFCGFGLQMFLDNIEHAQDAIGQAMEEVSTPQVLLFWRWWP